MLNIISRMGEISWLSSFKTVGGIKSGPVAVCGFKLASNLWMPSDVWHRRVGTGPFVRKLTTTLPRLSGGSLLPSTRRGLHG